MQTKRENIYRVEESNTMATQYFAMQKINWLTIVHYSIYRCFNIKRMNYGIINRTFTTDILCYLNLNLELSINLDCMYIGWVLMVDLTFYMRWITDYISIYFYRNIIDNPSFMVKCWVNR